MSPAAGQLTPKIPGGKSVLLVNIRMIYNHENQKKCFSGVYLSWIITKQILSSCFFFFTVKDTGSPNCSPHILSKSIFRENKYLILLTL